MSLKIDQPENYSAALYLRLSKEDIDKKGDDNSESIKNQRSLLENFATEENLKIYDTYIDDGVSGTQTKRPGLNRMIEDIINGNINLIIVKDMSRLFRNYIGMGEFIEYILPKYNTRLISVLDNYDSKINGYMDDIIPFKSIINEMYVKDTSKKITSVKRDQQKKGLFIGWKAPYGYKKSSADNHILEIDEASAKYVRYMFELALDGKSCREIAMIMNDENIPTPAMYAGITLSEKGAYSGKWSSETVTYMLKNEVYKGSMVQGRMRKTSYKLKHCRKLPKEEWTVVPNTHKPIIDEDTFNKVTQLIESRKHTRSRTYDYLLKGMIVCHECGYPLAVINRKLAKREKLYFVCRTYQRFTKYHTCACHCIGVEDVTNAVLEQVKELCRICISQLNMSDLTKKAQKGLEYKKSQQENASSLKTKLKAVESKIDRVYDDKLSNTIDDDLFLRTFSKLKSEQTMLSKKIQQLENSDNKDFELKLETVQELTMKFLNSKKYSKSLLLDLIEKIELTEHKEILIYFKFSEFDLREQ